MTITTPDLGRRAREMRFNPTRHLTPQLLSAALDSFEAGYLRQAALIWETIEERDDDLKIAVPKRRKSVSRQSWDILKIDDSPQAEADKELLTYFYNNLTATSAIDLNVRGGFRRLINQMMTAEFYRYSAHEIIWQPRGNFITAELRHVPLYFFENRTGRLRYTGPEMTAEGRELEKDGWLIHTGEGLHVALSICRMFKFLSLQDWLNFSEKFSIPGIHGETPAAKGTPEWDAFIEGLANFANDFIIATTPGAKINLIEAAKTGNQPFEPMVERMGRRIMALCRGGDLGTLSSKNGTGASLQDEESDLLLEDDCPAVSETCNTTFDRFVFQWAKGRDYVGKAYLKILPPVKQDTPAEINVDKHLISIGGELDAAETYERYGRSLPESMKGVMLKKAASVAPASPVDEDPTSAENDATKAVADFLGVQSQWLAPVEELFTDLISKAESGSITDAELLAYAEQAANDLPDLFGRMDVAAFTDVLTGSLGESAMEGARDAIAKTMQARRK